MVGQPYVLMVLTFLLMLCDRRFVPTLLGVRTNLEEKRFSCIRRMVYNHVSQTMWRQACVLTLLQNVSSWFCVAGDIWFFT